MDLKEFLPPIELWPELPLPEALRPRTERLNLTEELLEWHIREGRADCTAIYFEDEKISYGEIAQKVNRFGNSLLRLGVRPRDRVGLRVTNRPEAIIANFAILKIGAIPVPMSPLWSRKEIATAAGDTLMKALVVNRSLIAEVEAAEGDLRSTRVLVVVDDTPEEEPRKGERIHSFDALVERGSAHLEPFRLKQDDIAILLYTSGTTGAPKGCAHTAGGVLVSSRLITRHVWDLKEGDVLAGSAPVSFAAGFGTFALVPWTSTGALSLLAKFSAEFLLKNLSRHKVTVLTGIPTAYRKLLGIPDFHSYDLSTLRLCTAGGDALGRETYDNWLLRTGLPIWENLGTTEFYNIVLSNRIGGSPRRGSMGLPLAGYEARILDEDGNPCEPGKTGSLCMKGPTGVIYWNPNGNGGRLLKAQRACVRDGWSRLGDAAYRDEEGYIFFVGREDDMIKTSGYRLSPVEIEEALLSHPDIIEAAVIGVPDKTLGQRIKAFVVAREGAEKRQDFEQEIKEYCRSHMAVYKIPRTIQFVHDLPKSPTGKVLKKGLR